MSQPVSRALAVLIGRGTAEPGQVGFEADRYEPQPIPAPDLEPARDVRVAWSFANANRR